MFSMTRKRIATAILAATAVTGVSVASAEGASAYTAVSVNNGINQALRYAAANHFYMAPMTNQGIGDKIVRWCTTLDNNIRAGSPYSSAYTIASNDVASLIGTQKMTAVRSGADVWVC